MRKTDGIPGVYADSRAGAYRRCVTDSGGSYAEAGAVHNRGSADLGNRFSDPGAFAYSDSGTDRGTGGFPDPGGDFSYPGTDACADRDTGGYRVSGTDDAPGRGVYADPGSRTDGHPGAGSYGAACL